MSLIRIWIGSCVKSRSDCFIVFARNRDHQTGIDPLFSGGERQRYKQDQAAGACKIKIKITLFHDLSFLVYDASAH